MSRPQRCRQDLLRAASLILSSPENTPESEAVTLTLDEYEVIRLVDLEKKTHRTVLLPRWIFPVPRSRRSMKVPAKNLPDVSFTDSAS
ncbi:MAG: hypothetical protein ACLR6B_16835 [Blautia sp.]